MKRYSIASVLIVLLVLACMGVSQANSRGPDVAYFRMQQGWLNGQLAWFIETDVSDISYSVSQYATLAPLLSSADGSVPLIYFVRNPQATQGPIFEAGPLDPTYAGIAEVRYIDWNPGFTRVPIVSAAQVSALEIAGAVTLTDPLIILDVPIMAIGPLGGPWYPASPGRYRIKQATVDANYTLTKYIKLPTFGVFCEDEITERAEIRNVIIPDASDPTLAAQLGANLAPGLLAIDADNVQPYWFMLGPKPASQLPVIRSCPGWILDAGFLFPTNPEYTPVMQYIVLTRNIAQSTVVNNDEYVMQLIGSGLLIPAISNVRINAPVINNSPG